MRLLGAGLVVVSSGLAGLIIAASYRQRVRNLRQLLSFLQVLESEICYARATLPEVIARQKEQHSGAVRSFLSELKTGLESGEGDSFAAVWGKGLQVLADGGFSRQLLEDLGNLGAVLGLSDAAEQTKHLTHLQRQVGFALEEARAEQDKHTKLWSYLGFFAGLLIVLLLF